MNGYKSYVGIIGYALADVAVGMGWITPDVGEPLKRGFGALAGIGIAHKLKKAEK